MKQADGRLREGFWSDWEFYPFDVAFVSLVGSWFWTGLDGVYISEHWAYGRMELKWEMLGQKWCLFFSPQTHAQWHAFGNVYPVAPRPTKAYLYTAGNGALVSSSYLGTCVYGDDLGECGVR